jgi:Cupin domain
MKLRSLPSASIFPPDRGRTFSFLGNTITCKSSSEDRDGRLYEFLGTANSGVPPLHTHPWAENFYFLEGEVEVRVANRILLATPGYAINLPAGVAHTFQIKSSQAKFLVWASDEIVQKYLEELDRAFQSGSLSPEKVMAIAQKYGVRPVIAAQNQQN